MTAKKLVDRWLGARRSNGERENDAGKYGGAQGAFYRVVKGGERTGGVRPVR
jgi:hypothetical protein